jgi:hypothetical protein
MPTLGLLPLFVVGALLGPALSEAGEDRALELFLLGTRPALEFGIAPSARWEEEPQPPDPGLHLLAPEQDWSEEVRRLYATPGERHGGGYGQRGPFIPEPMVFDLVRSLGAALGEAEVNTLLLKGPESTEWAPEVEMVVLHNLAVEFELPIEESQLAAWKFAVQHTLGTGWREKAIYGWQGILEYRRASQVTEATLVAIGGARFDETWSSLLMLGGRAHLGGGYAEARNDLIANGSLFADVSHKLVAGLETVFALPLGAGSSNLLLMPQAHTDLSDHLQLQAGFGARRHQGTTKGELAMRLIWSF